MTENTKTNGNGQKPKGNPFIHKYEILSNQEGVWIDENQVGVQLPSGNYVVFIVKLLPDQTGKRRLQVCSDEVKGGNIPNYQLTDTGILWNRFKKAFDTLGVRMP